MTIQGEVIKKFIDWLQSRVKLDNQSDKVKIEFEEPDAEAMFDAGFDQEMIDHTLKAKWWGEMVTDIIETPDFAQPNELPDQVLRYARDVVYEYVGKRIL